jgi:transposase
MIALPAGMQVWLAAGATDMRKGFDGLSALVQTELAANPFSGQLFVFRGRAGERVSFCVLLLDTGKLQRSILAVFREVTWPACNYFPHAYLYSVGVERCGRDLPGR